MLRLSRAPHPGVVFAALIAVQVLFGINYVVSKIVVDVFPPLVWASLRAVIASCLLIGLALILKRPHPVGGKRYFLPLMGFALLGTIINQGAFLVGLSYTTSTNAAILNTLIPVFTLLVVTLRGQEPATTKRAAGFVCALAGVLVLRNFENFTLSDRTLVGDLLQIVNCLSFALYLSYAKDFLAANDRIWTTGWMFVCASFGLTALGLPDWTDFSWPVMNAGLWASAAFAIVGGTLFTYFLSNFALAHSRSSNVALFVYIQPVIASVLAWYWFDEPLTLRKALASGLIFAGLFLGLNHTESRPDSGDKGPGGANHDGERRAVRSAVTAEEG